MTVATGIETGAGEHPGHGQALLQAKGPGKSQGAGWAGAPQVNSSSSTSGNNQSFLSNWQTQLASMGAGLDGIKAEQNSVNGNEDPAEALLEEPSASGATAVPAVVTALPLRAEKRQTSLPGAGLGGLPPAAWIAGPAPRTVVRAVRQPAANGALAGAAPVKTSQSTRPVQAQAARPNEHSKSVGAATPPQPISSQAMTIPHPAVIPLAPISIQIPAFSRAVPSQALTDSRLPTSFAANSVAANSLPDTLPFTGGAVQKTDGVAVAQIPTQEKTQSKQVGQARADAPAAVSSPAPLTDSPEKGWPPPSGLPDNEASSSSGWPVAQAEGVPESLRARPGIAPWQQVDATFQPAPEMPDGTATPIDLRGAVRQERSDGRVSDSQHSSGYRQTEERNGNETGIQIPASAPSPQIVSAIPNIQEMTSTPRVAIENMGPVRTSLSAPPLGTASSNSGGLAANAGSTDEMGMPVRALAQSPQIDSAISNAPGMISNAKIDLEEMQPAWTQESAPQVSPGPSDSARPAAKTDRAGETGMPVRASAPSPKIDPAYPSALRIASSAEIGVESEQAGRSQPGISPSSDPAIALERPNPDKATPNPAVVPDAGREQQWAPGPMVTGGAETDGPSSNALLSLANAQPGSISRVDAGAHGSTAGEGSPAAKAAQAPVEPIEINPVRGPGLNSSMKRAIIDAHSGLNPGALPATLVQSAGQVSSPPSIGSAAEIGIERPEANVSSDPGAPWPDMAMSPVPATAENTLSSIAADRNVAEVAASSTEMPTNAGSVVGPGPIQPATLRGIQPLTEGDAPGNILPPIPSPEGAGPEDAGLTGGTAGSVQTTSRTTRGSGADFRRGLSIQPQPVAAPLDSSALARNPVAVPAVAYFESGSVQASAGISPGDAFAALDGEAAPGKPVWTHATPQRAEAGFEDPALGWVGVRADLSGGGVHASLMPGSAQAAQDLGRHMDGLNAFLAEQHTPVDSLVMGRAADATAGEGARHGMQPGMDQGANQGTNHGTSQGRDQNAQQQAYTEPGPGASLRMTSMDGLDRFDGLDGSGSARTSLASDETQGSAESRAGMHISVVA